MSRWTKRLDRWLYPDVRDNWDDWLLRDAVLAELHPSDALLDLGAGAGIVTQMDFRGHAARICGLDPDPRVVDNPFLDEAAEGVGEHVPWPDATFDVVVADNVLEHLERPEVVFAEVSRVLKPGGRFVVKTPNRRHYMPFVARHTPLWFHRSYNRLRGRDAQDTFPTVYKANTPEDLRALAELTGMRLREARLIEGRPEYLRLSAPTYVAGAAWERLINRVEPLARYRVLLLAVMVKAESPAPPSR